MSYYNKEDVSPLSMSAAVLSDIIEIKFLCIILLFSVVPHHSLKMTINGFLYKNAWKDRTLSDMLSSGMN